MRAILFSAAVLVTACGDNRAGAPQDPAPIDARPAPDAATARTACVDRPTDMPAAPTGELPCDLLPPGFAP